MKKAFHLHIAMMIAKALYESRDAHMADFDLLRSGKNADGTDLTVQDKLVILDRMTNRAGKTVVGLWIPSMVLTMLEAMWEKQKADFAAAHRAKTDKPSSASSDSVTGSTTPPGSVA